MGWNCGVAQCECEKSELSERSDQSAPLPVCWSADGKFLVYTESGDGDTKRSTWLLPMDGDRKPIPFLNAGFSVDEAKLSPVMDGRGRQ